MSGGVGWRGKRLSYCSSWWGLPGYFQGWLVQPDRWVAVYSAAPPQAIGVRRRQPRRADGVQNLKETRTDLNMLLCNSSFFLVEPSQVGFLLLVHQNLRATGQK